MSSALQRGINAAKAGQMRQALDHLKDAIVEEPENASVWVWLAAIIEDEDKQTVFLRKALELDPNNRPAQRGMAFIQRKKSSPSLQGSRLSDYTHPVGTFKASVPPIPAGKLGYGLPEPVIIQQVPVPEPVPIPMPAKSFSWELLLYALTLLIFIVIGFLVGNTLKNINFRLSSLGILIGSDAAIESGSPLQVNPVVTAGAAASDTTLINYPAPQKDGVYLIDGNSLNEMKLYLNAPTSDVGIPDTNQAQPAILVKTIAVTDPAKLRMINAEGKDLVFDVLAGQNGTHILIPSIKMSKGKYCLVNILNSEQNQSLYWCLKVK